MAKTKGMEELFHETLKDIFYAEKQILRALPGMAKAVRSPELKTAFEHHREQTKMQIERLEEIFELLEKPARGKTCDAINGILEEGKGIMEDFEGSDALDAGLLAAAQSVEHYEISRYGTLIAWADQLGHKRAVTLLRETLQEEEQTDRSLTDLACRNINRKAA